VSQVSDYDCSVTEQAQPDIGEEEESGHSRGFDTSVPHPARIYDYWLGGKDNFAADRQAAEQILAVMPFMRELSRANRMFLATAVHYLVQAGVRQFLDIGTGLPAANNTHEVAQREAKDARIVYVDNDPIVLSHAQALLASTPEGACDYLDADARDTERILEQAGRTLDFGKPVALTMLAILHFIPDADRPHAIVSRLMKALPSGSYLAISHAASDIRAAAIETASRGYNANSSAAITARPRRAIHHFFDGLNLVPPGLVPLGCWTPGGTAGAHSPETSLPSYSGVARKP
jgi:hypothetical protein